MIKKLLSMMTIAVLMASCSSDELEVVSDGNEAQVSFTVALNSVPGSRAISDGTTVDQLYYEVYDKDGVKITGVSGVKESAFQDGLTETITITLAKGQTYTFAFWAQKKDVYKAGDLKRVELKYEGVAGNDETRDAFYAYTEPITVKGNFEQPVTLKRPFAQLNLAVSDLADFKNAGVELDQVEVTVSEVASNFDVTTGKVTGAVPAKFNLADVLCNGTENPTLKLSKPISINGTETEELDWVSMNYLLVNDETTGSASSNVDVTFTIKTDKDDVVLTSTGTPVQRNYRTNIIASLTNKGTFNIVIDPLYYGEAIEPTVADDVFQVTRPGELLWIATQINEKKPLAVSKINITADLDLSELHDWTPINLWNPEGGIITEINGNGHSILNMNVKGEGYIGFIGSYASSKELVIKDLTFVNPVVESSASFVGTVVGYTYGNVTLDNVKVTGADIKTTAKYGIRIGGLIGFYPADAVQPLNLNECVVETSTITGYHNLAGLVGTVMGPNATFTNCQSNNNTFYYRAANAAAWQNYDANSYAEGNATKTNCSTNGNAGYNYSKAVVQMTAEGKIECLTPALPLSMTAAQLEGKGGVAIDAEGNTVIFEATGSAVKEAMKNASELFFAPNTTIQTTSHEMLIPKTGIVIHGNGATITGGEQDFSIQSSYGDYEEGTPVNVTITDLNNVKIWGSPSNISFNINLYNCTMNGSEANKGGETLAMVRSADSATGTVNMNIENCYVQNVQVGIHTTHAGTTVLKNCTFKNAGIPLNIAKKSSTAQSNISVIDCIFESCGILSSATDNSAYNYAAPVRVVDNGGPANSIALLVDNCTFTGTLSDYDILLMDYREGKTWFPISYTIKNCTPAAPTVKDSAE